MELIHAFLDYLSLEKKYSKHTIISYNNDLTSFNKYLITELNIDSIEKVHYNQIRAWIVSLVNTQISNTTINRKVSSLNTFYKFLIRIKVCKVSPLQNHKSLKTPKKVNLPFNQKEIKEVLLMFNDVDNFKSVRNKLIIELLYATGMRRNELIELKITDLDQKQHVIKVLGKRNKERYIPLLKMLEKPINQYLEFRKKVITDSNHLFLTEKGNKLYGTLVYRLINDYFSAASTKVKKSPHILRHAFATHLLSQGADLNAVKELLGHASLASTQVYTNSSLKELKNVYNRAHPRSSKN